MEDTFKMFRLLVIVLQVVCCYSAAVNNHVATTKATTHKPTAEPGVWHGVSFHFRPYSMEMLLIMMNGANDCYCMPLTDQDVKDTQSSATLLKLESFMLNQIAAKLYSTWTPDDLAVRDGHYGVKECLHNVYRVYRI